MQVNALVSVASSYVDSRQPHPGGSQFLNANSALLIIRRAGRMSFFQQFSAICSMCVHVYRNCWLVSFYQDSLRKLPRKGVV